MSGWFGQWFGGGGTSSGPSSPVFPALANATTADLIRDRMLDVIEALTPTYLAGDKFRRYRNEGDGDFQRWALANPPGSFRRFQVREVGGYAGAAPMVDDLDSQRRVVTFQVLVAYPQTNRAGAKNSLDRDTAMSRDQDLIEIAIGARGRTNFSAPYPDAAWRSRREEKPLRLTGVDFLLITQAMEFVRQEH